MKLSQVQQTLKKSQEQMNKDISETYKTTCQLLEKDLQQQWKNMQKRIEENIEQNKKMETQQILQRLENMDGTNDMRLLLMGGLLGIVLAMIIIIPLMLFLQPDPIVKYKNIITYKNKPHAWAKLEEIQQKTDTKGDSYYLIEMKK